MFQLLIHRKEVFVVVETVESCSSRRRRRRCVMATLLLLLLPLVIENVVTAITAMVVAINRCITPASAFRFTSAITRQKTALAVLVTPSVVAVLMVPRPTATHM
jgi:hypothetical protein